LFRVKSTARERWKPTDILAVSFIRTSRCRLRSSCGRVLSHSWLWVSYDFTRSRSVTRSSKWRAARQECLYYPVSDRKEVELAFFT